MTYGYKNDEDRTLVDLEELYSGDGWADLELGLGAHVARDDDEAGGSRYFTGAPGVRGRMWRPFLLSEREGPGHSPGSLMRTHGHPPRAGLHARPQLRK